MVFGICVFVYVTFGLYGILAILVFVYSIFGFLFFFCCFLLLLLFFFYDYLVNGILWTYLVFVYSMVGLWHMGHFSFYS